MDPNPFRRRAFRWPWRSKSDVRAEVDEELRFHLDMRTDELRERGMSEAQARREAVARFGDLAYTRSYCIDQDGRKEDRVRRRIMLDELRQDVVIGCRRLWKTRAVAGVALVTLALGIGANTAVFSLVNAALLRPLPYGSSDRLVVYYEGFPKAAMPRLGVSPVDFLDFARDQKTSETLAIFQNNEAELGGVGAAERVIACRVSPALFPLLRVNPVLGRSFAPSEDQAGADVVVLSHALWERRFAARADILGRTVMLDRRGYTVVGVMPEQFYFPLGGLHENAERADAWIPFVFSEGERTGRGMMYRNGVVGRLKPGVTIEQARAEGPILAARTWSAYPAEFRNMGLTLTTEVVPLRLEATGDVRLPLLVLLASVALVLLVACANVANLLLSRAAAREHEMVVMCALGASRGRLRQMLMTESLILGLASGAAGLALAWAATRMAPAALPARLASLGDVTPDMRVAIFTFLLSVATALVFGLVPAGVSARGDLNSALRASDRTRSAGGPRRALEQALVVVTVALSAVLLVGAGLLTRSFAALVATDTGIHPEHVLTATLALPRNAYREGARIRAFYEAAMTGLQAIPGVRIAALSTDLPLAGREHLAFAPQDSPIDPVRLPKSVAVTWPLGDYFRAHGIALQTGRLFTGQDREGAGPVVIVNDAFAKQVWPGLDPIGKRFKWGLAESPSPLMTVVGVVADVKDSGLDQQAAIHAYEPYAQVSNDRLQETGDFFRTMSITLKTTTEPAAMVAPMRREIARLDPALALSEVATMEERVAAAAAPQRLSTVLMAVFAATALLMAAIGLYGILAYGVALRLREMGVRLALGASPADVTRLVARQGLLLVAAGLAVGMPAALALGRVLSSLLYQTTPHDAVTLAGVPLVLAGVALLACYLPARRAAQIDPVHALRVE